MKKARIHKEFEALVQIEIYLAEEEGNEPWLTMLDFQYFKGDKIGYSPDDSPTN